MNNSMLRFDNQIVLVTGSTRGIGKTSANLFIQQGAKVLITGTPQECPAGLKEEWGNSFEYISADFSTRDGINSFISKLRQYPRIDVCVNNAGINRLALFHEVNDEDYDEMLSVNMNAPFSICRFLAGKMKQQHYGRVVNIASIWGVISKQKRSVYTVTKNAIIGLTKNMAVELAAFGVIVNSVSPGFTMTELTSKNLAKDEMNLLASQVPLGRFAEPHEIAKVILFLCSKENSYMTGQNIIVDGGFTNV
jgi:3-oxoacyl-[acyl-carrier protein] reductase